MDTTRPSRRVVLAGTAAFAGTAMAAPLRAQSNALDADVIVVGAGMAGLNTAWLLEQQGAKVMLLEGRQRVGGRVFTLLDEPGYPEMGFNSMGAGYGRGIDAAQRAKVDLVDLSPRARLGARQELVLGGRTIAREAWPSDPANPFPAPYRTLMPWEIAGKLLSEANPLKDWVDWFKPGNAPLDVSYHDFLRSRGLSDAAIRLAVDVSPYHGTSSYDVSALMYEYSDGWTKGQIAAGPGMFGVKGGNMRLPMAMARLIRGDLLMGREVVGVAADAMRARVTCRDGRSFAAKRVVMTLPFSTLRHVHIEPGLTGDQAQAVATLLYQPLSIMFLRVAKPYWMDDARPPSMWTDGTLGNVTAQRFGATDEEITGLTVSARGALSHYWDRLGAEATKAMVIAEIERLRPAAKGQLRAAYLQSWSLDPFNGGDWAVVSPGQARLVEAMAKPAGRLHFAGEHTATANRGLEAALESSERVVLEVVEGL